MHLTLRKVVVLCSQPQNGEENHKMEIAERIARLLIEKGNAAAAQESAWAQYSDAVDANPETAQKRKAWNDASAVVGKLTREIDELTKQMLGGLK